MSKIGDKEFWAKVSAFKASVPQGGPERAPKEVRAEIKEGSMSLYIDDYIDSWFGIDASTVVKAIHDAKGKNIDVFINSGGGSVFDGLSIYNALQDHDADVKVTVTGIAASISSIIALGGKEKPTMRTGTRFMIHNASVMTWGDHRSLRAEADLLESISDDLAQIYVNVAGMDKNEVQEYMNKETFFTAEEAVTNGLAVSKEENDNGAPSKDTRNELATRLLNCRLKALN